MKKIGLIICILCFWCSANAQIRTDSIHVSHYDINLNIIDFVYHQIDGYTDLSVVSKVNGLSYVDLDLQQLTVDSVFLNSSITTNYVHSNNLLRIQPDSDLQQNDTLSIRVYYHGVPATDSQFGGFYFSGQYAYNLGVAFHDIPHNFGRVWYPCLDFFTDKSTYHFNIRTENGKKAICGGILIDSVAIDDSTKVWSWQLDEPVPTYLTSVAVGNYLHYADTVHGLNGVIPIDIYTPPTYFNQIAGSFSNLKNIFRIYESRYGAYRWNRVGYVAVNFNYGAMEHATNIAYPQACVNGNSTYESLYAHELSHSWFGNLVTCAQAEEMWINEGFARFSEAVANEILYPNANPLYDGYRVNIRDLHRSVLLNAHLDDGGFFALNAVPQNITYGTTSYDKGALVVHTLRNYLGDSLFFSAIQQMLTTYSFNHISSSELFDFLSETTHVPLTDFFEAWVNQPGFLHFSVDSVRATANVGEYAVSLRQRLYEADNYANSNLIDLSFFAADGQQFDVNRVAFSGQFATVNVQLPFEPAFTIVDMNEKLGDAVIDYNFEIFNTGSQYATSAKCRVITQSVSDTVFVHVENNFVTPDPLKVANESIYFISNKHYWRVEYAPAGAISGKLQFTYKASSLSDDDYDLLHNYAQNDIVLLYRRDAADDWRIIPSTMTGSATSGNIYAQEILPGEYTLGIGDRAVSVSNESALPRFSVLPNPAQNYLIINCISETALNACSYEIFSANGVILKSGNIRNKTTKIEMDEWGSGIYFVQILQNSKPVKTFKVIKN